MILSALWLTVRITYTQLGRILHIFYDSNPFNFPRLTFSVLFQIYFTLDYGKCNQCKYRTDSLWLHICTTKVQTGLTIFRSWPLECCCLSSKWNWFPCTVPSQTAPAVWLLQTISPWTKRAKKKKMHRHSNELSWSHQWRVWINLHTSVVSIKCAAGVPPNLF